MFHVLDPSNHGPRTPPAPQAIDLRGHGESSRSSRHLYSVETLTEDLHELVVRLSLNGRDWGGAWTRPWVLLGKGMGAAVAVAYAVRHVGRVGGLVLWDYDPEWPKDRLNFYPYQAAHFANQQALGSFLNNNLQLAVRSAAHAASWPTRTVAPVAVRLHALPNA